MEDDYTERLPPEIVQALQDVPLTRSKVQYKTTEGTGVDLETVQRELEEHVRESRATKPKQRRGSADELEPQPMFIIQRKELMGRILKTLNEPYDRRLVFLHGPTQVGKTFFLQRLQEALMYQFVPVLIRLDGWDSIASQSTFLYELGESIQFEIESSTELQVALPKRASKRMSTAVFSRFMYNLIRRVQTTGQLLLLMFDDMQYLVQEETDRRIFDYLTNCVDRYIQQARFIFACSGHRQELLKHGPMAKLWAKGESFLVDCFPPEISQNWVTTHIQPFFELGSSALKRVIDLADGHPSFLPDMLRMMIHYWKIRWRKREVDENDLNDVIQDICNHLSPKLTHIWHELSEPERRILQQVAHINKARFKTHEIGSGQEANTTSLLAQLVQHRILGYDSHSGFYAVRLGLLVESISLGVVPLSIMRMNHGRQN